MRRYSNIVMEQVATELTAGLLRLRKGYVDAAEALLQIIHGENDYPLEFVVYRLTGYRKAQDLPVSEPITGRRLRGDLLKLILDLCDSFTLNVSDYSEPSYDTAGLARRFNVSIKTIQRWHKAGLVARRLMYADGKRRIAFLESSIQWFTRQRRKQIARSMRFSQMSEGEKQDILRRARRMANFTHCCLSDVAKRIAARTGRSLETIRYTIRRFDREFSDQAIFPDFGPPLSEQDKLVIYRCFLRGVSVPSLAQRYRRTRGSIYRMVNEMRAAKLLERQITYVYNPQFDLPGADGLILADSDGGSRQGSSMDQHLVKAPSDLPPYLQALYDVPLLEAGAEKDLFRRFNYLKFKADKLRKEMDLNHVRTRQLRQTEAMLLQADAIKNQIVRANLRLVVSIAKKHLGGPQSLFELISDGNISLMKAVEKFDYSRGYRFSTYASWAIMRNFARSVPKEKFQLDRFATGSDEILDIASSLSSYDDNEVNVPELRESLDTLLAQLAPRERSILIEHFGLDQSRQPKTLDQLGQDLGLSKERVRQIEIQALMKLRKIIHPMKADFMS